MTSYSCKWSHVRFQLETEATRNRTLCKLHEVSLGVVAHRINCWTPGTPITNKHYACTTQNHTNSIFFGKIPNFRLFWLVVFIVWKGFCFFLEYSQTHFSCLFLPMLKGWKNCQFLTKISDKTPLEKAQIFDFFNLLFLQSGNAYFLSRILSNALC